MAPPITITKPKTRLCFSFAAYSKDLITHLRHHSNIPVADGLTETELSTIESTFHFSFPPDLRSILQEGLPVGPGFPNWRSSSPHQLQILTNLPILGLCRQVYRRKFWHLRWGDRPEEDDEAVDLARGFLRKWPVLVPAYRNYYIPSAPCLAGNPVFYVNGLDVKVWSYDVVGFFQQTEFNGNYLNAPVWAATVARRIEFWTEMVDLRCGTAVGGGMKWWRVNELGRCLEDVWRRLTDGGWKEEDVKEMMMMIEMNGSSSLLCSSSSDDDGNKEMGLRNREDVLRHVRVWSLRLLRAGWSRGDVMDSLGCLTQEGQNDDDDHVIEIENGGVSIDCGDSLFDFEHTTSCLHNSQRPCLRQLMKIHA